MNALNEVNKVIASVSYYTHRHANPEEEDWLTAERVAVSNSLFDLKSYFLFIIYLSGKKIKFDHIDIKLYI